MTTCTIDGCDRPRYARDWCVAHYKRWWKTGSTQADEPIGFRRGRTVTDRFWAKVAKQPGDGCWRWTGATAQGYGTIRIGGRLVPAHRWSWVEANGAIPARLQLDHLCRVPACVRPSHLEPVTQRENILRGEGLAAQHARQTHCKRGHLLSGENLYVQPSQPNSRRCRACERARRRAERQPVSA